MSDAIIRAALEKHLNALDDVPAIAWENVHFDPTIGTPHIKCNLTVSDTKAAAIGPNSKTRYDGIFYIDIFQPENQGPQAGDALSSAITSWFKHGTILTESGDLIHILKTQRFQSQPANSWYLIPMMVTWYAFLDT